MNVETNTVPFHTGTQWKPVGEGRWQGGVSADWTQGRTAFGGYVVAGAVRAVNEWIGPGRSVRNVATALMHAIEPGEIEAHAEVLREGRNVSVVEVRIRQHGQLCSTILVTCTTPRDSSIALAGERRPDDVQSVDEVMELPFIPDLMPPCTQHFKCRWTEGQPPFTGAESSTMSGWIRIPEGGKDSLAAAIAMMDAYPFPMMQMLEQPAPVTSITWNVHLLDAEGADPAEWWWLRNKTIHTANGYATFATRLYRPDGNLAAWAEQLIGIYG